MAAKKEKGKEKAGDYEITLTTRLGGQELILGYAPNNKEYKYMTAYRQTNFLGDIVYPEAIGSDDYFTVISVFMERLQEQAKKVKQFRASRSVPFAALGREHCRERGEEEALNGKLIILSPASLAPEYRTADCQLGIATGRFGYSPGAGGRAVYFRELYSGEECRWDIGDVLGIADTEKLPDWTKEKLVEYEKRCTAPKKERGEAFLAKGAHRTEKGAR